MTTKGKKKKKKKKKHHKYYHEHNKSWMHLDNYINVHFFLYFSSYQLLAKKIQLDVMAFFTGLPVEHLHQKKRLTLYFHQHSPNQACRIAWTWLPHIQDIVKNVFGSNNYKFLSERHVIYNTSTILERKNASSLYLI